MLLHKIEVKGFSSFREHNSTDIPMGITGIIGSMEDAAGNTIENKSNGSGKTSIVSALLYALYGVGEYDRQEEIWNDKLLPAEEAFVVVHFSLLGNEYKVIRGKKAKGAYVDITENGKRIGDSNDEAQEFIIKLLGMDSKLFTASVFFAQKKLASFIETEPAVRKGYIDTITGITTWRKAAKLNKQIIDTTEVEQGTILNTIKEIETKVNSSIVQISDLEKEIVVLPLLMQAREEKQKEIDKIKNVDLVLKSIQEYKESHRQIVREITTIEGQLTKVNLEEQQSISEFDSMVQQFNAVKNFDILEKQNELQQLFDTQQVATSNLNKHIEEERIIYTEIIKTEADIKTERASLLNITEAVCSRCKQAVTKEFVELYNAQGNKNIENRQSHLASMNQAKKDLDAGIKSYRVTLNELNMQYQQLIDLINNTVRIKDNYSKAAELFEKTKNRLNSDRERLNSSLVEKRADETRYTAKLVELQEQLPTMSVDRITLETQLEDTERKIKNIYIKQGVLQKLITDKDKFKQDILDSKEKLELLKNKLYALEVLSDAFKDIPTILLQESITEIESYANEFIQSILPQFKVCLYEDLEKQNRPLLVAFEAFGKRRNYKLLSGGQQTVCAIGLRIGFNRVIARKAKVTLNFLVLDEIFSALDGFNRSEVLRTLISLNQLFPQILVITHTEEAAMFPRIIHARMDSYGNSRILH